MDERAHVISDGLFDFLFFFASYQKKKQSEPPNSPVSTLKDGGLAIAVHAKPGAKQNAITGWVSAIRF